MTLASALGVPPRRTRIRARCWKRRPASQAPSVVRPWVAPLALHWRRRRRSSAPVPRPASFRTIIAQYLYHQRTTVMVAVTPHWHRRIIQASGARPSSHERPVGSRWLPIAVRSAARAHETVPQKARDHGRLVWRIVSERRSTAAFRPRAPELHSGSAVRWREHAARAQATSAVVAAPASAPVPRSSTPVPRRVDASRRSALALGTQVRAGATSGRPQPDSVTAPYLVRRSRLDQHSAHPESTVNVATTTAPVMRFHTAASFVRGASRGRFDRAVARAGIVPQAASSREGTSSQRRIEYPPTTLVSRTPRPSRPTATSSARSDHGSARGVTRPQPRRTQAPELVWRTTAAPLDRVHAETLPSHRAATASEHAIASTERSATAHAAAARTTPASPRLDPAMLDRLADDVMQRLDRRMRIERERRGL